MMLLDRDPSAEVLTAGDVPTTLELIGREGETADLLILDLNLPGVEGTELMEEIVRRQPMLKILVLSGLTDRGRIMRVLQLGAAGFVPKSLDTDMLTNAIEFVLRGGVFIPSKLLAESQREGFFSETARSLPHLSSNAPKLTDRQKDVLMLLAKGAPIKPLLYGGYSTLSLGYIGLYELTYLMTGKSHTTEEGQAFALEVMNHLNETVLRWRAETNIGFALYGTPAESLCYSFAEIDRERYGTVENVTDKGYYTNSYHVDVREDIDAFSKFQFESQFQSISKGGCISYVEVPNMQDNLEAVMSVLQFIYDNIMYAELNTKSDYCQCCGYDGEIKIVEDDGKLVWECPKCGNRDQNKLNVARRTCGYIGTQFWNQGRTQEIKDRVLHL